MTNDGKDELLHQAKHLIEDVWFGIDRREEARIWLDERDRLNDISPDVQENQ